jgi:hypothetical protein
MLRWKCNKLIQYNGGKDIMTRYKKENNEYTIRTINLKLVPEEELIERIDEEFEVFSTLHDIGVNRYARLPDTKNETLSEEAKKMRRELKSEDISGTFVDLAVGQKGAESYFRLSRDNARKDITHRDDETKKLEKENINLTKPESVWFNTVKKVYGTCCMCGREGKMPLYSNEFKEALCEVCAVDFFTYRETIKANKRHVKKNYRLCKDIAEKEKLSIGLIKEIDRFEREAEEFKGTISNSVKMKGGQWSIDFERKHVTITLRKPRGKEKMKLGFLGDHYYNNFPTYGLFSNEYNFKKLIEDHSKRKGIAFLTRAVKNGDSNPVQYDYYFSVPTHYPMKIKEKVEGCILVSARKVLLYINGKAKFVELYNPYLKKRLYGTKQKEIQGRNKELCICDWNRIPQKNHMLLTNLKKKLGFGWINEYEVTVKKSEDGKIVTVEDDNDINRSIEISINQEAGTAELRSLKNGECSSRTLYIVESKAQDEAFRRVTETGKKSLEKIRYRKKELYLEPQIPMPKKYAEGNLLKHIKHKNKETARHIVEEAKKMLSDEGSVVVVDYTGIHPEKELKIPIISLNDQITNMLRYDSIYRGSISWGKLKVLICPRCGTVLPEKLVNRYIVRDIFFSKTKRWICDEDNCGKYINSPILVVARQIMNGDIKELLKRPSKKEKEKDEKELGSELILIE